MKVVIKIGTSTLTHEAGLLNIRRFETLCKVISDLKNSGHEVILVTSGSIGMGVGKLSMSKRPEDIPTKQAVAAIGQCELMYVYDRQFSKYNHTIAQILITNSVVKDEEALNNFRNTINRLLELNALPIINENDTVSTAELGIGDNDSLAAIVATSIGADLLILLSDIDGLYDCNPKTNPDAVLIKDVYEIDEDILQMGAGKGSELGTGGMKTKLLAAKKVMDAGIDMVIANGSNPTVLYDIVDGKDVGTRFYGKA